MKTLLSIISMLLVLSSITSQSDTISKKGVVFKVNALSIFRESIEGSLEKQINNKSCFELVIGLSSWQNKTSEGVYDSISQEYKFYQNTIESFKLYNIKGQWNYYLTNRKYKFSGLYIGPYLKIVGGTVNYSFTTDSTIPYFGKENDVNLESSLFSIATGGNLGYQFNIKENITLGAFLQLGYKTGKVTPYHENKDYNNEYSKVFTPLSVKGFDTNLGINLGIIL